MTRRQFVEGALAGPAVLGNARAAAPADAAKSLFGSGEREHPTQSQGNEIAF